MNLEFFAKFGDDIASERIDAYRQDGVSEEFAIGRYVWNVALSEALYPTLQFAEIALRNSFHKCLSTKFGGPEWYNHRGCTLLSWQGSQVNDAKDKLREEGKPRTPGRIVAELPFGFWTSFLNKEHSRTGLAAYLAKNAFSNAEKADRDVRKLEAVWTQIRDLRNRVFHHERIVHWTDLETQYQNILRAIRWLSPEIHQVSTLTDRFPDVRSKGVRPWVDQVQKQWP